MSEREYGYVSATFSNENAKYFEELTSSLCKVEDLYYSNNVDYVHGDVSKDLHMTVFYGLLGEKVDKNEIQSYINQVGSITLSIGGVSLRTEHKKLCQILWIDVLDTDDKLFKFSEGFKKFPYEESEQLGFVPHLTLAYVKNNFVLKNSLQSVSYPRQLNIDKISYHEI